MRFLPCGLDPRPDLRHRGIQGNHQTQHGAAGCQNCDWAVTNRRCLSTAACELLECGSLGPHARLRRYRQQSTPADRTGVNSSFAAHSARFSLSSSGAFAGEPGDRSLARSPVLSLVARSLLRATDLCLPGAGLSRVPSRALLSNLKSSFPVVSSRRRKPLSLQSPNMGRKECRVGFLVRQSVLFGQPPATRNDRSNSFLTSRGSRGSAAGLRVRPGWRRPGSGELPSGGRKECRVGLSARKLARLSDAAGPEGPHCAAFFSPGRPHPRLRAA
jgi:hypothetical protein